MNVTESMELMFLDDTPVVVKRVRSRFRYGPYYSHRDVNVLPADMDGLPFVPLLATLVLILTIVLLLVLQQNPRLVAAIVAGVLTSVAVYLFLTNLSHNQIRYE